jgi:hypothetical protein
VVRLCDGCVLRCAPVGIADAMNPKTIKADAIEKKGRRIFMA